MSEVLPILDPMVVESARNFAQDVAKILGKLQQVFVPADPHDWDKGLIVTQTGLTTVPLRVGTVELSAIFDMRQGQLAIGGSVWQLSRFSAPELLVELQRWLTSLGLDNTISPPTFGVSPGRFEAEQSVLLITSLWWLQVNFERIRKQLNPGFTSPVLLFPHHFDLSLVWFPEANERQLALGFSTGDETIPEPYLYLTASPEPAGLSERALPTPAFWQHDGFSGAILRYGDLRTASLPSELLETYAAALFDSGPRLFNS